MEGVYRFLWLTWICSSLSAFAAPKPLTFEGATWIWAQGAGKQAGTWYFQKGFHFPAGEQPKRAQIIITCDNHWKLYINGKQVGQNDAGRNSWNQPQIINITKHLVIEQNTIAVEGENTIAGPAGLLAKMHVTFVSGGTFKLTTDATWLGSAKADKGWNENGFTAGENWKPCTVIGNYGIKPWGKKLKVGQKKKKAAPPPKVYPKVASFDDPVFVEGIAFVSGNLPFSVSGQRTFTQFIRGTRAYFEMDPMTPAAIGEKLYSLVPFKPGGKLTELCNADGGKIGSPSVSYDGKTIYFSMAKKDAAWFHIHAVDPDGHNLRQITDGPFHDYDPVELPDGRIAFSSTRLGSREEYHAKYASSLFTCDATGKKITPLTYHIVADREPRVTANGSLAFVRMDNFMERAKVEVHLHQTRLDGTAGQVIIGPGRKGVRLDPDVAAEDAMDWLRKFGAGSPAPLPDGRVAAISQKGLVTSASPTGLPIGGKFLPYDLSPLPDGRLLCTSIEKKRILIFNPANGEVNETLSASDLSLTSFHSVVHLGARRKPQVVPSQIDPAMERRIDKTGYLYCQNVLNTQHVSADLKRIKAIRVYEGRPFTLEPTQSIYEHIGTMGIELGTVPLAEDGSFYIEVPADRPLALQAIDGEGRAVINELSWIYTRPGEQRSCVGCHAPADAAPPMRPSKAARRRPLKLVGAGNPHRFRANNGANGGIVNLQLDRFREVASINLPATPEQLLASDDKLSAIQRLGILRDRSTVPCLVEALNDKKAEVRCAAALALSACGNRHAVQPLIDTLDDRNATVALAVRNALEHLTGTPDGTTDWKAAERSLIKKTRSLDQQEVHLAIEALGHIGGETGKKALRNYLSTNPDGELRVLMAAIRSLGWLADRKAVPLLVQIMNDNLVKKGKAGPHEFGFGQKPIYLSATAAEALGHIGTEPVEAAILDAFLRLNSFEDYNFRMAEHKWLMGTHASVIHYRMLEALDRMSSTKTAPLVDKIIESIPADKDRALLYELDSYERLTARVVARSGRADEVVETCLGVLADANTKPVGYLKPPHAEKHIRPLSPQARAAQVVSVICNDVSYAPRIRALLEEYRAAEPSETRAWCCFMLTRTLGRLGDEDSVALFIDMLQNDPTEKALGLNPPPAHIIYKGWRPFYRPAAAWSLGQLKAKSAVPALLKVVQDLDNASGTREQAAAALGNIGDSSRLAEMKTIAADYPEVMTRRALLRSIQALEK